MILLALLLGMTASALPRAATSSISDESSTSRPYSLDEILDAIRTVETGGAKEGGRYATGDGGRAIGPYQIHREHWLDTRLPGNYEDCRDAVYARREVITYWKRWCPAALERCDAEILARVHNGGPAGSGRTSTLAYWTRTQAKLEEARTAALAERPIQVEARMPRTAARQVR